MDADIGADIYFQYLWMQMLMWMLKIMWISTDADVYADIQFTSTVALSIGIIYECKNVQWD